jgi:hypothetical protein
MQLLHLTTRRIILAIGLLLAACGVVPATPDTVPAAAAPTVAPPTLPPPTAAPTAIASPARDHLGAALSMMPDTVRRVSFVDWEQIKAETGFPQLTGLGTEAERRDFLEALARTQALMHTFGLGVFPKDTAAAWQPLYEQWGWTSADLSWEASAQPPAFVLRFRDGFDLRSVVARLEQRKFARQDYHGVALYSDMLNTDNPPPWQLDVEFVNIAVLPAEHILVMGLVLENVQQLLDAYTGRRPTLGDQAEIQETVRLLGPVSSAVITKGTAICTRLEQMFTISRAMPAGDPPALREQIQAVERLHPYAAAGAGYRYDGQQPRAQIVFSYSDAATAQRDLPLRRQLAEQGYSMLHFKPFATFAFTVEDTQLDGASMVLHVRPVAVNPMEIMLTIAMPDAVFAGCPAT